ncbi:MAG: class I SAM-dependent methyltransferase [Pseudomonadota bacterium]|nr:class I SAM-dependent methyltransferase [Pseudomonadota bacterium]
MSLKRRLRWAVQSAFRQRHLKNIFYHPAVARKLRDLPGWRRLYDGGVDLQHPFDSFYGTETRGYSADEVALGQHNQSVKTTVYIGSQPSIIRRALAVLPPLDDFTFVDLGCGKGRPLLVASEFSFKQIIGVELSAALVDDAKNNVAILAQRFSNRVLPLIELCDAGTYLLPEGNIVLFLYNPFGEPVISRVIANLENSLGSRRLFVVYYNPVHGHCFDKLGIFSRYFAATFSYSDEEIGYGPDQSDSVVIWQAGAALPPMKHATARILVTKVGNRAEIMN